MQIDSTISMMGNALVVIFGNYLNFLFFSSFLYWNISISLAHMITSNDLEGQGCDPSVTLWEDQEVV